jgi:YD repeat-containing protein
VQAPSTIVFLLLLVSSWGASFASEPSEAYQYDPAGRLSRILSPDGSVTLFEYDSLGNLVSVRLAQAGHPPLISNVSPTELRAGDAYDIDVRGQNLADVDVLAATPDLFVSNIVRQSDSLYFNLSVSQDAPSGEQTLRIENADGQASVQFSVLPPLPRLTAGPLPLAIPDDGSIRQIQVRLSEPDLVDREVDLSVADPQILELLDSSVSITAGTTDGLARVRGTSGGITTLTLESQGLSTAAYAVYVTAAYGEVNRKYAPLLGISVGESDVPAAEPGYETRSNPLGIAIGSVVLKVDPPWLSQGASSVPVTIEGADLQNVDAVQAIPADGLSIDGLAVQPDGASVSVLVSSDLSARVGPRRLVLSGAGMVYPPAAPGADVLDVVAPPPSIDSIQPVVALRGTTAASLLIRGRHLNDAVEVAAEPAEGIAIGTELEDSADGTRLAARFSVDPEAPLGDRTIRVITTGGPSGHVPTAANRLQIVERALGIHGPVASPLLGVAVGPEDQGSGIATTEITDWLGIAIGPVLTGVVPQAGETGSSLEVQLWGNGLADVTDVLLSPTDGITVEAITPDPLGERVHLSLMIAPDAPQIWRELRVLSGDRAIPPASPGISRFLVTAPAPRISAVNPNTLRIGSGETILQLWGENFSRASEVSVLPGDNLLVGAPDVNEDGTRLTLGIRALTDATSGPRVLRVTTPAGTSSGEASAQNTLTLFEEELASPDPLIAPLVGVVLGESSDADLAVPDLPSTLVGVQVGPGDLPPKPPLHALSPAFGVAVGPIVTGVEAPPLARGATYNLRVLGNALQGVDGAGILPGLDVAVSSPVPSADGSSLSLNLTVPPDAVLQTRELRLVSGADRVPFADPSAALLRIGRTVPEIDSIQPIVARPGDTFELTVRGRYFEQATEVIAEPNDGLVFDSELTVNDSATELRVRMHISNDASIGPRTIRIQTPGGTSTDNSSPVNTFTVY